MTYFLLFIELHTVQKLWLMWTRGIGKHGSNIMPLILGLIQHVKTLWNLTKLLAWKLGHGG